MIKLLLLLTLTLDLFAQGTCYSVQLFSKTNSPQNAQELQKKKLPDSCKVMLIGNFLTARCGCYEGYSQAQKVLPSLKNLSPNSTIVTTKKSRFTEVTTGVIVKKEEPKEVKEPEKVKELIVPRETKISKELNATQVQKSKKIEYKSLEEDPLFHAARNSGLSIYDAINRAVSLSPKLNAASEVVKQDKEKLVTAEAGHLPTVNLSGDGGYETRLLRGDTSVQSVNTPKSTHLKYKKVDLYLTISENLWSGGSIEDAIDEQDANLKGSLFDYRDKLEALVVETTDTYFDVVYSEIALKISQKNMKHYEKILNIVTIKEKNGAATKGDVNFIRANVDNAKTELVQKEQALSDALAMYVYLLQVTGEKDMPYEISSKLYLTDLNTSLEEADKNNAKLLRQRSFIKATKFAFLATKGSFHPKVDFQVNAEDRNEFDIGSGHNNKVNALLTFNYNLYNGGKDEALAARLLAKMHEQKFLYTDVERNLVFEIKVLNRSVATLSQSLHLTQSEVFAARKVVESYWVAFQHGTQDLQALQLAQRNLNRAEQDYARYKKDLLSNNYSLMRKTGVLLKFLDISYKEKASNFKRDFNLFYEYNELE